jgi:hypothetical protein
MIVVVVVALVKKKKKKEYNVLRMLINNHVKIKKFSFHLKMIFKILVGTL